MSAPVPRERCGDVVEHAVADAHQRQDHGDLDADRDGAEQSPHRTVLQIFKNQTVDQPLSVTNGGYGNQAERTMASAARAAVSARRIKPSEG